MPHLRSAYKAIVFDFDGVIVDSEPVHWQAFAEVIRPYGLEMDYSTYLAKYVGYDDRQAFTVMLGDLDQEAPPDRIEALSDQKQTTFERLAAERTEPTPGARALIESLAGQGLPLAICSGATRRDIDLMLGSLGCGEHFDVIVSADDVARSKPDPEGYALAVERLAGLHPASGIDPGQCLAIEDTAAGVRSAHDAGLRTLALRTTTPTESFALADQVVDDLTHVDAGALRGYPRSDERHTRPFADPGPA